MESITQNLISLLQFYLRWTSGLRFRHRTQTTLGIRGVPWVKGLFWEYSFFMHAEVGIFSIGKHRLGRVGCCSLLSSVGSRPCRHVWRWLGFFSCTYYPFLYIFWRKNSSDPFTYSLIAVNNEWYENAHGDSRKQWGEMVKVLYEEMGDRAGEVAQQVRAKTQKGTEFVSQQPC